MTTNATYTPTKNTLTYNWISDPGHAWLEVSLDEIYALNIQDQISRYSYIRGERVYLEEDCDAGIFIEALKARIPTWEEIRFTQTSLDYDAPCRMFRRWEM